MSSEEVKILCEGSLEVALNFSAEGWEASRQVNTEGQNKGHSRGKEVHWPNTWISNSNRGVASRLKDPSLNPYSIAWVKRIT